MNVILHYQIKEKKKMNDYIQKIREWIETDYIQDRLGHDNIVTSIDRLDDRKKFTKFIDYIREGVIFLQNLVLFAKENDLLQDFIPTFTISLLDTNIFEDLKFSSDLDILEYVDKSFPPELKLVRKIDKTLNYHNTYMQKPLSNKIFHFKHQKFYTYLCMYFNNHDLEDEYMIYREINIEYNENNSKVVKNITKIALK